MLLTQHLKDHKQKHRDGPGGIYSGSHASSALAGVWDIVDTGSWGQKVEGIECSEGPLKVFEHGVGMAISHFITEERAILYKVVGSSKSL